MDMRFDQIDILIMGARNLGGILLGGSILGGVITFAKVERGDDINLIPWISGALSGLGLVIVCTGVLAQIVTSRAAQDGLQELRAIKDALKASRAAD